MLTTIQTHKSAVRRGFTLTEIAIVLGIIGIILGAIWAAAGMVYENNRTKTATTEALAIVNNWRSIFGSKRVDLGEGVQITQLTVNNAFASSEMMAPTGTAGACAAGGSSSTCWIEGPWSGSIVYVYSYQTENAIGVQYMNMSQSACNHLANSLSSAAGLLFTVINSTQTNLPPLGTAAPLKASDVSTQCNATGNTNYVLAAFTVN